MHGTLHWGRATLFDTTRARWSSAGATLLIALLALLPRVWGLGTFITFDEANFWLKRSEVFLNALASRDFGATAITVHPGVTTMWLGSTGILLQRMLQNTGLLTGDPFAVRLALMQLPAALVHAAGVVLGYRLLRRLLPQPSALLAALLWAADPFVIGYSRVLHVDALAGTFLTVSLLAACVYWHHERRARWLLLSGVCAGLAILSKSPALALLPIVALVALAGPRRQGDKETGSDDKARQSPPLLVSLSNTSVVRPLLLWGAICAATVFALWPALWVNPLAAYAQVRLGVEGEGAQPHQLGNFFLGRAYAAEDPGLRFYPVALALRATPWALLGLLLLPLALRRLAPASRRDILALAGFVVLFAITLDVFPKKFDRYLEPAFPAVDILAAVGLVGLVDVGFWMLAARQHSKIQQLKSSLSATWITALGLVSVVNVVAWHPYEIGAFNQALGGARAGAATFVVGWGEGLEQAAAWLNAQPDITGVTVAALRTEPLQAYLRDGAQAVSPPAEGLAAQTGYVVVYLPDIRGGQALPPYDRFFGRVAPAHTVEIHGVAYAWIYQVAPPVAEQQLAQFGPALQLRGYRLEQPAQPGQDLKVALYWATNATMPANLSLFAHVLGADGQPYFRVDPALSAERWGPQRFFTSALALPLPASLAPGSYELVIGVYDRTTGQRLPLKSLNAGTIASDGPDALKLVEFQVGAS